MFVLNVSGPTTNSTLLFIGCEERAEAVARRLRLRGLTVGFDFVDISQLPRRSVEEQDAACAILESLEADFN